MPYHRQLTRPATGIVLALTDARDPSAPGGEQEEGFRQLYELMLRLSSRESLDAALNEVLCAAIELVHADAGHIRLLDKGPGQPTFAVQTGFKEDIIERFGKQALDFFAHSPAVEALLKGRRIVVEDAQAYPPTRPYLDIVQHVGFASMQATPLINYAGKAIGTISTFTRQRHVPPDSQLGILDMYARLAADSIDRHDQREEQERTEQALRKAIAAKDEFLGLVSHELRTPMTVIRGLSSVLRRNPRLPEETLTETFNDLSVESERLYRIIENMLALARVQATQTQIREVELLDKLIESSLTRLRAEMPDLVVELQPLPHDVIIQVVPSYFDQTLRNLVENAHKYSPRGSKIELGACALDGSVQVHVADRGIGLKDPAALFKPFSREEEAEKLAPGLGLGLAVCRTLVEAQGGQIWAKSRQGGGAIFSFTLPR